MSGTPAKMSKRANSAAADNNIDAFSSPGMNKLNGLNGLRKNHIHDKPDELFRKDLISAMKIADSEHLEPDTFVTISDPWKQDWERGVQVPVAHTLNMVNLKEILENVKFQGEYVFKLPKKMLYSCKDENYQASIHELHDTHTLAEKVCRYDLDDNDVAWLTLVNQQRVIVGEVECEEYSMERIMEELETQCYNNMQTMIKTVEGLGIEYDENVVCDVCRSPESEDGNEMLFCDLCDICVHQGCYGIATVPKGQWMCRSCALGLSSPKCVLCPKLGGAMKSTKSGTKWTHVSCALWIKEVSIGDPEKMEPITRLSHIPASRWALVCSICRVKEGACIQCAVKSCKTAFHVTCAHSNNFDMQINVEGGDDVQLKAYCPKHTTKKSLEPTTRTGDTPKKESEMTEEEKTELRSHRLQKLAEEFYTCVKSEEIAEALKDIVEADVDMVDFVKNYWVLKRKANFNKPLLTPRTEEAEMLSKAREENLMERLKMFIQLRQDLERVRNLCYLVSKREKTRRTDDRLKESIFQKQLEVVELCRDDVEEGSTEHKAITGAHKLHRDTSVYDQHDAILMADKLNEILAQQADAARLLLMAGHRGRLISNNDDTGSSSSGDSSEDDEEDRARRPSLDSTDDDGEMIEQTVEEMKEQKNKKLASYKMSKLMRDRKENDRRKRQLEAAEAAKKEAAEAKKEAEEKEKEMAESMDTEESESSNDLKSQTNTSENDVKEQKETDTKSLDTTKKDKSDAGKPSKVGRPRKRALTTDGDGPVAKKPNLQSTPAKSAERKDKAGKVRGRPRKPTKDCKDTEKDQDSSVLDSEKESLLAGNKSTSSTHEKDCLKQKEDRISSKNDADKHISDKDTSDTKSTDTDKRDSSVHEDNESSSNKDKSSSSTHHKPQSDSTKHRNKRDSSSHKDKRNSSSQKDKQGSSKCDKDKRKSSDGSTNRPRSRVSEKSNRLKTTKTDTKENKESEVDALYKSQDILQHKESNKDLKPKEQSEKRKISADRSPSKRERERTKSRRSEGDRSSNRDEKRKPRSKQDESSDKNKRTDNIKATDSEEKPQSAKKDASSSHSKTKEDSKTKAAEKSTKDSKEVSATSRSRPKVRGEKQQRKTDGSADTESTIDDHSPDAKSSRSLRSCTPVSSTPAAAAAATSDPPQMHKPSIRNGDGGAEEEEVVLKPKARAPRRNSKISPPIVSEVLQSKSELPKADCDTCKRSSWGRSIGIFQPHTHPSRWGPINIKTPSLEIERCDDVEAEVLLKKLTPNLRVKDQNRPSPKSFKERNQNRPSPKSFKERNQNRPSPKSFKERTFKDKDTVTIQGSGGMFTFNKAQLKVNMHIKLKVQNGYQKLQNGKVSVPDSTQKKISSFFHGSSSADKKENEPAGRHLSPLIGSSVSPRSCSSGGSNAIPHPEPGCTPDLHVRKIKSDLSRQSKDLTAGNNTRSDPVDSVHNRTLRSRSSTPEVESSQIRSRKPVGAGFARIATEKSMAQKLQSRSNSSCSEDICSAAVESEIEPMDVEDIEEEDTDYSDADSDINIKSHRYKRQRISKPIVDDDESHHSSTSTSSRYSARSLHRHGESTSTTMSVGKTQRSLPS